MVSMVTLRGMMMWLVPCTVEEDVHLCQVFGQIENVLLFSDVQGSNSDGEVFFCSFRFKAFQQVAPDVSGNHIRPFFGQDEGTCSANALSSSSDDCSFPIPSTHLPSLTQSLVEVNQAIK